MKKQYKLKIVTAAMFAALVGYGANTPFAHASATENTAVESVKEQSYIGSVLGVSKKAKSISISVGKGEKAKTLMLKYDNDTKGIEHAKKGEKAIVLYEIRNNEKFATIIKPKLAKLPKGVTEIMPADVAKLVAMGPDKGHYFLVDSRPAGRFAKGHIPTSVSIPVEKMKKEGASLLPTDKDFPLIFHCGGPT